MTRLFRQFTTLGLSTVALVMLQTYSVLALSATEVGKIARSITVLIMGSQGSGSGVLLKKDANTYTVLTAYHVLTRKEEYEIITADEKRHRLDYSTVRRLPNVDLATVQFTSPETYTLAAIGDSTKVAEGAASYVAGFPIKTVAITERIYNFTDGRITANAGRPLLDGYALVYTNPTLPGMSGGPVLNSDGQLIGIHGRADTTNQPQSAGINPAIYVKTGFNLGIPIHTYLSLNAQASPTASAGSAPSSPSTTTPRAFPETSENRADDYFLQAGQKASQGNFQGAIADYSQAIKVKPNYSAAYSNRGIVRSALDDPEGAMADFNRAIDLNPMFPEFFVGRGLLRSRLKDRQGAIADYSQAIQISPTYALAYYNRGVVHYNLGNQQQAATDLRKAADLYLAQGNRDEYQRAIETLAIAGKTCRQSIRTMCDW